ncbi:MAG TPA: SRPBCC family protein [Candidatus Eisenbacteria bacterium]|nr:SRPBCC family protein [Candidatus Eisenbacteria bacterium]
MSLSITTERQVEIAAPAERVWTIIADVEHWHEWTASITSIRLLDGPLAIGARAEVRQPKLPRLVWHVTALEQGRFFDWEVRSPGALTVGSHRVEPQGSGSLATLKLVQAGPIGWLVARMMLSLTREYVSMEAAGLKKRAEGARPA